MTNRNNNTKENKMVVYIVELVETKGVLVGECENMGVFESLADAIEYAKTIADERLSDTVRKEVPSRLDSVRFRLRTDTQVVDVVEYRVQ
jgi:hypothetical protein